MSDITEITERSLQGVWKRDWIEINDQRSNCAHVLWAQAGNLFVDLRIPYDRPDVSGYRCLEEVSDAELAQLKKAEGFAGRIEVQDSICTWHREINWQGPPTEPDSGALHFEPDGALTETGVHANYSERWTHGITPPIEAHRFSVPDIEDALQGIVIFSKEHFFFGVGLPVLERQPLSDHGATAPSDGYYFGSEYAYGRWNGTEGVVELHTNPFCEKRKILSSHAGQLAWHRLDSHNNCNSLILSFT